MSICASGSSTTQPGVPAAVVVDQAYVKSLLPSGWEWLYDYLPYMQSLAIGDVGTFCAVDPPTFGLPSASDFYTFITGGYASQNDLVTQFINDVMRAYVWYHLCQCSSGTTPSAPSPATPPSGIVAINPPAIVSPNPATPCLAFDSGTVGPATTTALGVYPIGWASGQPLYPVPAGASYFTMTATRVVAGSSHNIQGVAAAFYEDQAGTLHVNSATASIGPSTPTAAAVLPVSPNMAYFVITDGSTGGNTDLVDVSFEFFCNGQVPGGTISSCCAPDPLASGLLAQILAAVTLLQRQVSPFAYVPGAVHSGLSGMGQFAIQGDIGLSVDLTTVPSRAGLVVGDPNVIYGCGWISIGTADGWLHRELISANPFLAMPRDMGAMTLVGYSLLPGVIATITELVRES